MGAGTKQWAYDCVQVARVGEPTKRISGIAAAALLTDTGPPSGRADLVSTGGSDGASVGVAARIHHKACSAASYLACG